jgi:hypothetical protein
MTALANLLRRIWPAINRIPHQTWWGIFGISKVNGAQRSGGARRAGMVSEIFSALVGVTQGTLPTVLTVFLNVFR